MAERETDPTQEQGDDGTPKFGRLLIVLALAVGAVVALTFVSVTWFGR